MPNWSRIPIRVLLELTLKVCSQSTNFLENNGGHFRFGNFRWRRIVGNTVEITLETAWRRDYSSTYWQGRGADGLAITGSFEIFSSRVIVEMIDFHFPSASIQEMLLPSTEGSGLSCISEMIL